MQRATRILRLSFEFCRLTLPWWMWLIVLALMLDVALVAIFK